MGWVLAFFLQMFRCSPGLVHITLIPKSAEITQTFSKQGEAGVQTCDCVEHLLGCFLSACQAFGVLNPKAPVILLGSDQ